MILLGIVLVILFLIITVINYRQSVIFYILLRFLLLDSFYLIDIKSLPLLSVNRILLLILLIRTIFYLNSTKSANIRSFPLNQTMIKVVALLFIVSIFAYGSTISNIFYLMNIILEQFSIMYVIWISFDNKKKILNLLNYIYILFFFITLYGIYTWMVGTNPFINFFADTSNQLIFIYDSEFRSSANRIQSVFHHPIAYGGILSIIGIFVLNSIINYQTKLKLFLYGFWGIIMLNLILTNSRTPILAFIVSILFYFIGLVFSKKPSKSIIILLSFLVLMILLSPIISTYSSTLYSAIYFYDDTYSTTVGGSTFEGRLLQVAIAFEMFLKEPLLGHGLTYIRELILSKKSFGLLGAESFLIKMLINLGIIGSIGYIILFTKLIMEFKNSFKINNNYNSTLLLVILAVIPGYLFFIFGTGDLDTFPYFFIFIGIGIKLKYILLNEDKNSSSNNSL